jgi:hypothetical protein
VSIVPTACPAGQQLSCRIPFRWLGQHGLTPLICKRRAGSLLASELGHLQIHPGILLCSPPADTRGETRSSYYCQQNIPDLAVVRACTALVTVLSVHRPGHALRHAQLVLVAPPQVLSGPGLRAIAAIDDSVDLDEFRMVRRRLQTHVLGNATGQQDDITCWALCCSAIAAVQLPAFTWRTHLKNPGPIHQRCH